MPLNHSVYLYFDGNKQPPHNFIWEFVKCVFFWYFFFEYQKEYVDQELISQLPSSFWFSIQFSQFVCTISKWNESQCVIYTLQWSLHLIFGSIIFFQRVQRFRYYKSATIKLARRRLVLENRHTVLIWFSNRKTVWLLC